MYVRTRFTPDFEEGQASHRVWGSTEAYALRIFGAIIRSGGE